MLDQHLETTVLDNKRINEIILLWNWLNMYLKLNLSWWFEGFKLKNKLFMNINYPSSSFFFRSNWFKVTKTRAKTHTHLSTLRQGSKSVWYAENLIRQPLGCTDIDFNSFIDHQHFCGNVSMCTMRYVSYFR